MQTEAHRHSGSHRTNTPGHAEPTLRLSRNARVTQAHGHARTSDPSISGSPSQADGTPILTWHLTCICPPAAHGPETEQPQARNPRCPHPGPERSAPAPENHRDREGGFLSSHGMGHGQVAAGPWGPGPSTEVAGGLARHQSLSEAQPQALG